MRITFIYPSIGRRADQPYPKAWTLEPLAFAVLAGLTPKGIDLDFFDDRLERLPFGHDTDAVMLSVEAHTAMRAYELAGHFRRRGIPVVLGGYHPTLCPEEAAEHADAIVVGEAEGVWKGLLDDLRAGTLKKIYKADKFLPLEGIAPQREIYRKKGYFPMTLIETGRGCHNACNFCSIASFYRSTYRSRPIADILREVKAARWKHVFFIDDNLAYDTNYAKELFRALDGCGIRWSGQAGVRIVEDDALLSLIRKSGCAGLLIGFESLHQDNLRQMHKQQNLTHSFPEVIGKFRAHGVAIYSSFVFGYDHDDPETIRSAAEQSVREKTFYASFNHLIPYPGTRIYAALKEQGRLLHDRWWLRDGYRYGDVVFTPARMSPEALAQACLDAKHRFFSYGSILRRMDLRTTTRGTGQMLYYLKYNMFFNREMDKRQGLLLGHGYEHPPQEGAGPLSRCA